MEFKRYVKQLPKQLLFSLLILTTTIFLFMSAGFSAEYPNDNLKLCDTSQTFDGTTDSNENVTIFINDNCNTIGFNDYQNVHLVQNDYDERIINIQEGTNVANVHLHDWDTVTSNNYKTDVDYEFREEFQDINSRGNIYTDYTGNEFNTFDLINYDSDYHTVDIYGLDFESSSLIKAGLNQSNNPSTRIGGGFLGIHLINLNNSNINYEILKDSQEYTEHIETAFHFDGYTLNSNISTYFVNYHSYFGTKLINNHVNAYNTSNNVRLRGVYNNINNTIYTDNTITLNLDTSESSIKNNFIEGTNLEFTKFDYPSKTHDFYKNTFSINGISDIYLDNSDYMYNNNTGIPIGNRYIDKTTGEEIFNCNTTTTTQIIEGEEYTTCDEPIEIASGGGAGGIYDYIITDTTQNDVKQIQDFYDSYSLSGTTSRTFYMDDYFKNADTLKVTYNGETATRILEKSEDDTTTDTDTDKFEMEMEGTGDDVRLTISGLDEEQEETFYITASNQWSEKISSFDVVSTKYYPPVEVYNDIPYYNEITGYENISFNLDDRYGGFNKVEIYYEGETTSESLVINDIDSTTIEEGVGSHFNISLTSLLGEATFLNLMGINEEGESDLTLTLTNTTSGEDYTKDFTLRTYTQDYEPPTQELDIGDMNLKYNTVSSRSISQIFSNYNRVTASFEDSDGTTGEVEINQNSGYDKYEGEAFDIWLDRKTSNIGEDDVLKVESNGFNYTTDITVTAYNDNGNVEDTFTLDIAEDVVEEAFDVFITNPDNNEVFNIDDEIDLSFEHNYQNSQNPDCEIFVNSNSIQTFNDVERDIVKTVKVTPTDTGEHLYEVVCEVSSSNSAQDSITFDVVDPDDPQDPDDPDSPQLINDTEIESTWGVGDFELMGDDVPETANNLKTMVKELGGGFLNVVIPIIIFMVFFLLILSLFAFIGGLMKR